MAVYMRPARKTKLIRCEGNWKDRDEANRSPEFGHKGNGSIKGKDGCAISTGRPKDNSPQQE